MSIEYVRPPISTKQESGIFCDERYGVVEASTKSGKTVGCIIWLFEQAIQGGPGRNYWWVAPVYKQAKVAFTRLWFFMPEPLRAMCDKHDTDLRITLPNGSVIWFLSAEKPDNLYGEDVWAAVVDEATRCREESWHAVRTTLSATGGPVRIIGNVKGRKNWAYRMARRAESGEPDMHYEKMTIDDAIRAGFVDESEREDVKRQLPEQVYRELYYAEPSDDAGNPFGIDPIRECVAPMPNTEPVCWGWDLAKSQDWTVGYGLDEHGRVCRMERYQRSWEDTIDDIVGATDGKPALVDSTGVGDPVLEALQKRGGSHFEGFKFTSQSKQQIMEGLRLAIQDRAIRFPDGVTASELEAFEYEYSRTGVRYSAPEGMHDDCVCALALAWSKYSGPRGDLKAVHASTSTVGKMGGDW